MLIPISFLFANIIRYWRCVHFHFKLSCLPVVTWTKPFLVTSVAWLQRMHKIGVDFATVLLFIGLILFIVPTLKQMHNDCKKHKNRNVKTKIFTLWIIWTDITGAFIRRLSKRVYEAVNDIFSSKESLNHKLLSPIIQCYRLCLIIALFMLNPRIIDG